MIIFQITKKKLMAPPTTLLPLYSVVWARQKGYPPWPAVITASPLTGHWVLGLGRKRKYHCTFLAWNKEWSWLEKESLKPFTREVGEARHKKTMVKNSKIAQALKQAIELGLKILIEPNKVDDYLVMEDKEIDVEEKFVERLLSEIVDDVGVGEELVEGEPNQEEMFVDSILEETVFEEISLKEKNILKWEFGRKKFDV